MLAMQTGYPFSVMVALQYLIQVEPPVETLGEYQAPILVKQPPV